MKNIILLLALVSTYAMSGFSSGTTMQSTAVENEDKRLCKAYIAKAHNYKETMRSDKLAQATFDSYKDRVVSHCGAVNKKAQNMPYFVFDTKVEVKSDTKALCKSSIKKANNYKTIMTDDQASNERLDSYKKNVVSNCGTLMAKS